MPGQEGAQGDDPGAAYGGGQVSGEGGEHSSVGPGQPRPDAEPAAQDDDLVPQHEQLDILGAL